MAIPNIDDFDDLLIGTTDSVLGDSVSYKPAGGEYAAKRAFVDYGEALREAGGTGMMIDTDITVTVSKAQIAEKPTANARIILGKMPEVAFKPFNVRDIGNEWTFEVKRV